MPPRLVAAVSGGPMDGAVLREAYRLAATLGVERVIVLHVVDSTALPAPPDTPEGAAMLRALRERALGVMEASVRVLEALGLEALPAFREGKPCAEIVDFASKARADVVLLGASDGGEPLGSTALCVAARYPGNVLVVKGGGEG